LNRKRPLSLAMIRNLHAGLAIPLEVLVRRPKEQAEEKLVLTRQKTAAGIQP